MSKIELLAKIELLNKYEAMMEEIKAEADTIRNSIKAEMEAREVEELIAGQYIVRYTSILSNRFDNRRKDYDIRLRTMLHQRNQTGYQ